MTGSLHHTNRGAPEVPVCHYCSSPLEGERAVAKTPSHCRRSRLEGRESGTPVASYPCIERKFRLVSKFHFGSIDGKLPHTIIGKIMTFVKTDLQPSYLSADFMRDFLQGMDLAG